MIVLKSPREIAVMRRAGRVVAGCLEAVRAAVAPGVTTRELDRIAHDYLRARGAVPSFLGYAPARGVPPYPASICASVNDEVVHGIPGDRALREGDIVTIDVGAFLDGYHGDAAATYPVGRISPAAQRLLDVTGEALRLGIAQARPGKRLGDIGHAIQSRVEAAGFSVVREYTGHGIGRRMHEDPQVPSFGRPGTGPVLKAGMVIAIEPIVNAGRPATRTLADGWTVVTADGTLSAEFEHTVAVTARGPEILTRL